MRDCRLLPVLSGRSRLGGAQWTYGTEQTGLDNGRSRPAMSEVEMARGAGSQTRAQAAWADSGRESRNKRVEARRGEGEFPRLAVVGLAKRKSEEMMTHPGCEEAGGDDGFVFAPRCDGGQRK